MDYHAFTHQIGFFKNIQLASDGQWERALTLLCEDHPMQQVNDVRDWLSQSSDIALEVFFQDIGFGEAFLGVRLADMSTERKRAVIEQVVAELCAAPSLHSLLETIQVLQSTISPSLFKNDCTFVEVGVVNAWRSIGACQVWHVIDAVTTKEALKQRLRTSPQVLQPLSLPIAAEIAFVTPCAHWVGIPVSEKRQEGFTLNPDRLWELVLAVRKRQN
jgi:hypothetical protein